MSKQIDLTKPLSEEDAAYVADRPWILEDAKLRGVEVSIETNFTTDNDEAEDEDDEETGADDAVTDESEDDAEDDELEDDYEEWNVEQLKAELKSRGLTVSGSKEQLIERLQASDDETGAE